MDAIKANIDVSKRRYLIDATFKVVPEGPYYQFLVIYVEYVQKVDFSRFFWSNVHSL